MEKLGVVGLPSDWLIASGVDYEMIQRQLHIELVDIPIEEVTSLGQVNKGEAGAVQIYERLKQLVSRYGLSGLTLRCFDLLSTVGNTGCLALSRLNDEGVPAACEGDIPTLLTMLYAKRLTGCPGFQCNPARIRVDEDSQRCKMLWAHCTIPLTMTTSHSLTTHFESGIGVAIHGELPLGDYTLVKMGFAPLAPWRVFAENVQLVANQYEPNLCRTQVWIEGPTSIADYLLHDPIANHHVLVPGHHAQEFLSNQL